MSARIDEGGMVSTVAGLLAHALTMQSEACQRCGELADQMAACHNATVAAFFHRLENLEKESLRELETLCRHIDLPHLAPWEYQWAGAENPKTIDVSRVHYQMSSREAALLALEHERRAAAFYAGVAAVQVGEVRTLACRLADAQLAHQCWLEDWLATSSSGDSIDDPDPPNSFE